MMERCFELRITKNSGRMHGFLFGKVFYLVWFDPAHNLIPGKFELRDLEKFRQVKTFSTEEFQALSDENAGLRVEIQGLTDLLDTATK